MSDNPDFLICSTANEIEIQKLYDRMLLGKLSTFEDPNADPSEAPVNLNVIKDGKWLSGDFINCYLRLICQRNAKNANYPKIHALSTYAFGLMRSDLFRQCRRFLNGVSILDLDYLFVPIHSAEQHWLLAVLDMKKKKIQIFDSLYLENRREKFYHTFYPEVGFVIKKFLDYQLKDTTENHTWEFCIIKNGPRQLNEFDCGVFTCQTAEWLSRNCSPQIEQCDIPKYRKQMLYELVTRKLINAKTICFPTKLVRGIKFNESRSRATNVGCDKHERLVTGRAIQPTEKITIKVMQVKQISGFTFGFGITNTFWDVDKLPTLSNTLVRVWDEIDDQTLISFWITKKGEFVAQIGDEEPLNYYDVDMTIPHRISFDLNGAVRSIKFVNCEGIFDNDDKIYRRFPVNFSVNTSGILNQAATKVAVPCSNEPLKKKTRLNF